MLSALILMTLLPLNVTASNHPRLLLDRPVSVVAFVDAATILGLPKLKLRDDSGNRYQPEKTILQEPLAVLQLHAGVMHYSQMSLRKAYIQSYVRK